MSLLDRGPFTVEVVTMTTVQDGMGSTLVPSIPVTVTGLQMQPVSSEEADALGTTALTTFRLIGRGPWPGGPHSRVTVTGGPHSVGRMFDQRGEARLYGNGRLTRHVDVLITAAGSEMG